MTLIDLHTHTGKSAGPETFRVVNLFPADDMPVRDDRTFFSAGLHPWYCGGCDPDSSISSLEKMLESPYVIAVGEAGLDKVCDVPMDIQRDVFIRQAELAASVRKPLLIHCVKTYQEIIGVKDSTRSRVPWIIHGFRGSLSVAEELIRHGFFVSSGAALLDLRNSKLRDCFRSIPLDCVFLETDESHFTIEEIYRGAAAIKGVIPEELADGIKNNFIKVFGDILR